MPLPAAWHPLSPVGTAGKQESDRIACADAQVHRLLGRRQLAQRQIHSFRIEQFRYPNFHGLPEATATASVTG